jgi:hypothetical protein
MLAAIHLYDQPCFVAVEINDVGRDGVLASKFPASKTMVSK